MATHPSVKSNSIGKAIYVSEVGNNAEAAEAIAAMDEEEIAPFRTLSEMRDLAPVAYMPSALAKNPRSRNLRRMLTREQGRALETIGHAVDYLNDSYLYEGHDSELINIGGPSSQAIQILVTARQQIFMSAPIREPRTLRMWNALFHRESNRGSQSEPDRPSDRRGPSSSKPASVLPLSSSR